MKLQHPLPLSGSIAVLLSQDTGGGGGSPQQQPQPPQQQQAVPEADPFKDIDLDLLPDDAREAIVKARAEFAQNAKTAAMARQFQSEKDKLASALAQTHQQLQALQQTNQQQQPQQVQPELTMEEELLREYVTAGMPEHIAKIQASTNAKVFGKHLETAQVKVAQHFAPYVQQTAMQTAQSAFAQIANQPFAQDPEVVQQLQQAAGDMLEAGQDVTPEILSNLGAMYHYRKLQATPPQVQPSAVPPVQPVQPRTNFSFQTLPVGGAVAPVAKRVVDPAIAAAMQPIKDKWKTQFRIGGKQ